MSPHLIILSVDQCQLEFELCGINGKDPGATFSVQAVHIVPLHTSNIDRQVQGADDAMVPMPTQHMCDKHTNTSVMATSILKEAHYVILACIIKANSSQVNSAATPIQQ